MKELDLGDMFAEGAKSAARENGMSEKDAEAFASSMRKEARKRLRVVEDDEDDDEGTWWSRNKSWLLPAAIGTGAFWLGSEAMRGGRPDQNAFSNAWDLLKRKLSALFPSSPFWKSVTYADWRKLFQKDHPSNAQAKKEMEELELLSGMKDAPKGAGGLPEGGAGGKLPFGKGISPYRPAQAVPLAEDSASGRLLPEEWDGKLRPQVLGPKALDEIADAMRNGKKG